MTDGKERLETIAQIEKVWNTPLRKQKIFAILKAHDEKVRKERTIEELKILRKKWEDGKIGIFGTNNYVSERLKEIAAELEKEGMRR